MVQIKAECANEPCWTSAMLPAPRASALGLLFKLQIVLPHFLYAQTTDVWQRESHRQWGQERCGSCNSDQTVKLCIADQMWISVAAFLLFSETYSVGFSFIMRKFVMRRPPLIPAWEEKPKTKHVLCWHPGCCRFWAKEYHNHFSLCSLDIKHQFQKYSHLTPAQTAQFYGKALFPAVKHFFKFRTLSAVRLLCSSSCLLLFM